MKLPAWQSLYVGILVHILAFLLLVVWISPVPSRVWRSIVQFRSQRTSVCCTTHTCSYTEVLHPALLRVISATLISHKDHSLFLPDWSGFPASPHFRICRCIPMECFGQYWVSEEACLPQHLSKSVSCTNTYLNQYLVPWVPGNIILHSWARLRSKV